MSEDEVAVTAMSIMFALAGWIGWYVRVLRTSEFITPRKARRALLHVPLVCLGVLVLVLLSIASRDVRTDPRYVIMYTILGALWLILCQLVVVLLGHRPIEDVVQRANPAASWAAAGFLLGPTLCYAGGNIGDGPGWWVVIYAAFFATVSWFTLIYAIDQLCANLDEISIGRDPATGVRFLGTSIALGLILGRGVAGTWVSAPATLSDFARDAWPALVIAAFEVVMTVLSRILRGSRLTLPTIAGFPPALLSIGGAVAYILSLGWWA